MNIKKDCQASSGEFWYDLNNGYLKPEEILEKKEDSKKVYEAIKVVNDFESSCEDQIEGFVQ